MALNCSLKFSIANERQRAQLMTHAPHLDTIAGVRIGAILRGHQEAPRLVTSFLDVGRIVVQVAQDTTGCGRQFPQQERCDFIVSFVRGREFGC